MPTLTPKRVAIVLSRSQMPLHFVTDPRAYRGCRQQSLDALLRLVVVGFACGKRTLRAIEALSGDMKTKMRWVLGLRTRRVSDTTLHELLLRLYPWRWWRVVTAQVKADLERKVIRNDRFIDGVVAYDGKKVAFGHGRRPNRFCLQTFVGEEKRHRAWMLKSLRSCLVSSAARPVLGQTFLPHEDGEATAFPKQLKQDVEQFPRLFRYVTGDAGITSRKNAKVVRSVSKHYCFAVKGNSPMLYDAATTHLARMPITCTTTERYRGGTMTRQLVRTEAPDYVGFKDATQLLGVIQTHRHDSGKVTSETRYFITSIPTDELTDDRLLTLVRLHWQIENGPNYTSDVALEEDDGCPCNTRFGPVTISWLRLIAYNLMAVFRARLPKVDKLYTPWWRIKELVYQMLTADLERDLFITLV